MRLRLLSLVTLLLVFAMTALGQSPEAAPPGMVYVKGYYRKDGSYVKPHYRKGSSKSTAGTVGSAPVIKAPRLAKAKSPRVPKMKTPSGFVKGYKKKDGTYVPPHMKVVKPKAPRKPRKPKNETDPFGTGASSGKLGS